MSLLDTQYKGLDPVNGRFIREDGTTVNLGDLLISGIPILHGNKIVELTIDASASLSDYADVRGYSAMAIYMPAAWTAANLTFAACHQYNGTFNPVYGDDGNEIVVYAAASRAITVDIFSNALSTLNYLKVRSGTNAVAVAQAAERKIYLMLKGG